MNPANPARASRVEQTIVAAYEMSEFQVYCRRLLNSGWKIIPGTVAISSVYSATACAVKDKFVAFFEREVSS